VRSSPSIWWSAGTARGTGYVTTDILGVSLPSAESNFSRVELHRMKIIRPMPEVGKYTMIFHTRDRGNEVNIERMKLLHQVSRVWRTDGLTSCIYKLLSVDYNPLYTNITVDFWSGA